MVQMVPLKPHHHKNTLTSEDPRCWLFPSDLNAASVASWLSLGLVDESSWSIKEETSCWMKTILMMREDSEMLLFSAAPSLSFLTPLAKCMLTRLAEGLGDANSWEGRRCVHWTLSPLVLTSLLITLMDRGSLSVSAGWPGSPPPSALASSLEDQRLVD